MLIPVGGYNNLKLIFKLIWIGLLIEIIILALIKPYVTDFIFLSTMAVSLHVIYTMALLIALKSNYYVIFFGAFLARVSIMLWDLYANHIFRLPNTGHDAIAFYQNALILSEDLTLLSEPIRGGDFTKFHGLLIHWIGPQQMLGHYINVLLGLTVVFIIYEILILLELRPKIIKIVTAIAAFFPASILMSAIFLREIVITFFVVYSLFYFIKWFKTDSKLYMVISLIMLGLSSIFHSGVVGIFFGYAFVFMFYNHYKNAYLFHRKTVLIFIFLALIVFLVVTQFNDLFLGKFTDADDEFRDIYTVADARRGGSVYLTNLTIDNPFQLIFYGPIRAFYFLTAPLPMYWRGLTDIFTFMSDSSLYMGTMIYFIKNRHNLKDKKVLAIGLILIIACVSLVFGIGTYNAGTAMRHRQKFVPIFLILFALIMDSKHSISNKVP